MSVTVEKENSICIHAPAENVWQINGVRFSEIGQWSRNVLQSKATNGPLVSGAPAGGRTCDVVGVGPVVEQLVDYEPQTFSRRILVTEGLPFFVKLSEFRSQVVPIGASECRFDVHQTMVVSYFPGVLLYPMLRRKLDVAVGAILADLKYYAENGQVHPDKALAQAS